MDVKNCQGLADEELARRSLGDNRFFYCLMKRYEERLKGYVRHLTYLSDEDVEDVIQNSFIKAYLHLNDCDCSLKFSSWLYRIVHNEAINYLKKTKVSLKVEIKEDSDEFVDWLTADTNIEKETIGQHFKEEIQLLLEKLKPEYKEVLILRFMEEKDYIEISDILQKPMGTVATLLSRAKKQFKEEYEKTQKH